MPPKHFPVAFKMLIPPRTSKLVRGKPDPPVGFVGERFMVPDAPDHLMIEDIEVGGRGQFVTPGPVPARVFEPRTPDLRLMMDTITAEDRTVAVRVLNTGDTAITFRGALVGRLQETD